MSASSRLFSSLHEAMPDIITTHNSSIALGMNEYGAVFVDGPTTQTLYTGGLVGCTAVALIGSNNQDKLGYLQHFHPAEHGRGQQTLENILTALRDNQILLRAGVIFTPGMGHGALRRVYSAQYSWVEAVCQVVDAHMEDSGRLAVQTYRSPGRERALGLVLSKGKDKSSILLDGRRPIVRP